MENDKKKLSSLFLIPSSLDQNAIYDYLFIEDFSKIIEKLIQVNSDIKIMNVTPSESTDLISINGYIQKLLGIDTDFEILNSGYGVEYTGNNTNLLNCIGDFKFM